MRHGLRAKRLPRFDELLADLHVSPQTVSFLKSLGHDVIRVSEVLPRNATDELIIDRARQDSRIILTQDLDFSRIIAIIVALNGLATSRNRRRGS